MNYTTILVQGQGLDIFKKDILIKSGFAISGINFIRSVKSSELHIVIGQLAKQNISFNLQTQAPIYNSSPCIGCKSR